MKTLKITQIFCIVTAILAPVYWYIGALISWGSGPEDDVAIVYFLAIPILLHGIIVRKYGVRQAATCAFIYLFLVTIFCIFRYVEISNRNGYDQWHANRSVIAWVWIVVLFFIGWMFSVLYEKFGKNS